ncbi:GNAT family N-acetyltransferase [Aliiglaciecola litoralis]|uniref:GNAT family N-acetyltransferase n=1 Tax=Aliiglaciecola litoralis TaxID=582857 RepID=A0ABN1LLY3_9ALTE
MHFEFIHSIDQIPQSFWYSVKKTQDPFCNYAFLAALEQSGSLAVESGWQPFHLLAYQADTLVGMLPLYKKNHSYGEYVFDFAWADAYHRHGIHYYPKLVNAIPFTPVTGARLLVSDSHDPESLLVDMLAYVKQQLPLLAFSSIHCLFPSKRVSNSLTQQAMPQRLSVQFQWYNKGYTSFDDFIQRFTARRRKMVRKERAKIAAQNINVVKHFGASLSQTEMDFFYQCYCQTYLKRSGHPGYLNKAFFTQLLNTMGDNILLVIASKAETPIAGALYLYSEDQLCGRYWGAIEEADALHFECCYYQGIEFCIDNKLASFNPGTQGEHKILRGFEPTYCYSNHWLEDRPFQHAVERFIEQETPGIKAYKHNAEQLLPFKQPQG